VIWKRRRLPKFVGALIVALVAACGGGGGGRGPTAPACVNLAGSWNASYSNSCGGRGSGLVVIAQNACNFTAAFPGEGTATGSLSGSTFTFSFVFSPCSGSATGSGSLTGNAVNGTYQGTASGFGCCGSVSGSFTLTR